MTGVWYHGRGKGAGPRPIVIEDDAGEMTGVLGHVVRHSPTGMTWGYAGSGPADTARSLLIAALGDDARCGMCAGTGRIVYDETAGEEPPEWPWDPTIRPEEYEGRGLTVDRCWQWDCDGGFIRLPYQEFKFEFVAGWGPEFRMGQDEILAWLAARGVPGTSDA
jgi:hypothetical protein